MESVLFHHFCLFQDEGRQAFLHDQQMYENERRHLLKRDAGMQAPVPAREEGEEPAGGRERGVADQFRPGEGGAAPVEHMQRR